MDHRGRVPHCSGETLFVRKGIYSCLPRSQDLMLRQKKKKTEQGVKLLMRSTLLMRNVDALQDGDKKAYEKTNLQNWVSTM